VSSNGVTPPGIGPLGVRPGHLRLESSGYLLGEPLLPLLSLERPAECSLRLLHPLVLNQNGANLLTAIKDISFQHASIWPVFKKARYPKLPDPAVGNQNDFRAPAD